MFHLSTLKTKTFWTGLASVGAGAYLCYTGQVASGAPMVATGLVAVTGRDALTKLIVAMAQAKG